MSAWALALHARAESGLHLELAYGSSQPTGARMSVKERYIIGVDLGGTNIVAGAMPQDGSREIAMRTTQTLAEGGAGGVVDRIVGMIDEVIAQTMKETG